MNIRINEHGVVLETKAYSSYGKMMMLNIVIDESVRLKTKRWTTRHRQSLHVVIMNLIACVSKKQRLYYSRDKQAALPKLYNERSLKNRDVMLAVEELAEQGYLFNYVAESDYRDDDDKESSYAVATDKFIAKFCTEKEVVESAEFEHVAANINIELRNKKKKKIEFEFSEDLKEAERVVQAVNHMNNNHEFKDYAGQYMVNTYGRIFNNESFDFGGRWFKAAILKVKNKKTKNRLRTTINGESVVEVDYDCLHINMLCDIMGVSKYRGVDIYYHVLDRQHYSTDNRRLVKLGINIMLNATSQYKATNAIRDLMGEDAGVKYCYASAEEVVDAIYKKLPEFKSKFCSKESTGLRLQNKDSWIAHYVLDEFVKVNCPVLVVHDSFIVQRKHATMLVDAMCYGYKRVMNIDRIVSMKMNWLEGDTLQQVDCSK